MLDLSVMCDTEAVRCPRPNRAGARAARDERAGRVVRRALNAGAGAAEASKCTRIPLDASTASQRERVVAPRQNRRMTAPPADRLRWPWLDLVLAVAVLVELEIAVMTSDSPHGSLILNMIVVAVIALVTALAPPTAGSLLRDDLGALMGDGARAHPAEQLGFPRAFCSSLRSTRLPHGPIAARRLPASLSSSS